MLVAGALALVGVVATTSSPAAAASTDSVYVFDYPTNVSEPLPVGTPDVVTPLMTGIVTACVTAEAVPTYEVETLTRGNVVICSGGFPKSVGLIVAGAGPVGVIMPNGFGSSPGCGIGVYEPTGLVGVAPPGASC